MGGIMKETRHLGVYGLIIKNNRIALVLKSRGAYTGKLDLPGGSFEHGERPEETLKREIKEELNVDIKDYKSYKIYTGGTIDGEETNGLYTNINSYTGGEEITFNDSSVNVNRLEKKQYK